MKELIKRLRGVSVKYDEHDWHTSVDKAADALERLTSGDVELPDAPYDLPEPWGYNEAQLIDYGARCRADERERIAASFHYPECWDAACYPTLEDAIHEIQAWFKCSNDDCAAIRKGDAA